MMDHNDNTVFPQQGIYVPAGMIAAKSIAKYSVT